MVFIVPFILKMVKSKAMTMVNAIGLRKRLMIDEIGDLLIGRTWSFDPTLVEIRCA
jgi:hypothetical protein